MTRRRARGGFSLIEALIALTIAAMTLGAIFELQVQMARGQARAVRAVEQVTAQENAIALVRDVNPMAQPQGLIALPGGDTVSWSAEPRTQARINAGYPAGDGAFEVQLFTLTVQVTRPDGRPLQPLVFDRVGWRRTSNAADAGF